MSSAPTKITMNAGEVEVVDIPTMYGMSDEQYRDFLKQDGLMFVDHHEVLRDAIIGYPIATTREQLDILIEELQKLRGKMVERSGK
jgi:hypothetical protein